jgi:hypothetical protein
MLDYVMSRVLVTIDGVRIGEQIYRPLAYIRLGTTSTYSANADLNTLKMTRAQAKFSKSAFTSRFLVKDLNNGDSSVSVVTPLPAG